MVSRLTRRHPIPAGVPVRAFRADVRAGVPADGPGVPAGVPVHDAQVRLQQQYFRRRHHALLSDVQVGFPDH